MCGVACVGDLSQSDDVTVRVGAQPWLVCSLRMCSVLMRVRRCVLVLVQTEGAGHLAVGKGTGMVDADLHGEGGREERDAAPGR